MTCEDPACEGHAEGTAKYTLPIVLFKDETAPTYTAAINDMVQTLLTDCGAHMNSSIRTDAGFYEHINKAAREWVAQQEGDGPFVTAEIIFEPNHQGETE